MIRHKRYRSSSNSPRPDREFAPATSLAFSTSPSPPHHFPTTYVDTGGIRCIHAVSVELLRPETLNRAVTGLARKRETVNVLVAPDHRLSALGRDSPKAPLTSSDLFSVSAQDAARADIDRLLNYESRLETLRESPDLVDQFYLDQSTGKPSPAPYHAKYELQLVPWYYNAGKGGGLMESMDFTAFGVCLKQTRACTVAHLDLVTALVRSWEDLDMASIEEAHRCATWKGRQAILEVVVAGNKSQADARSFKYSLLGPRDLDPVLIPPAQQRDQDLAYKPIAVLLSILLQKNVVSLLM